MFTHARRAIRKRGDIARKFDEENCMIKSEFTLRGELLTVPASFDEPRLRAAAYAWLDMALELFAQEVYSALQMRWWRPLDGSAPVLLLELDSAKNFRTKKLQAYPDAPPEKYKRRERFDAAVAKLMSRTTAEDLWAALANQKLACIQSLDFVKAWERAVGEKEAHSYPRFADSGQFLSHLVGSAYAHPWR